MKFYKIFSPFLNLFNFVKKKNRSRKRLRNKFFQKKKN